MTQPDAVAFGIQQERDARLQAATQKIERYTEQLQGQLADAERQIAAMKADIANNCLPRYGGHLFATAKQVLEICTVISTINQVL